MKIFTNLLKTQRNRGMSYVELIVVLSIFSVMSSVLIFNYGLFQARVDIKNLASDIALKAVEAQRASLGGKLPPAGFNPIVPWKPSYGLYMDIGIVNGNKSFIYFTDLNNNRDFDTPPNCSVECLEKISITKQNTISALQFVYQNGSSASLTNLTLTFSRLDAGATIKSSSATSTNLSYAQITITSPRGPSSAIIKVYESGRIQVN
jgi:type II secretory pathway pseudopilin PulG